MTDLTVWILVTLSLIGGYSVGKIHGYGKGFRKGYLLATNNRLDGGGSG